MGFSNVIYEQAPSPNPMGAALVSAAQDIGTGIKSAQEIRNQRDQQLVTVAMQMLPRMAENPEMLRQFTQHPDFQQHILPAFNRMKLGSVFTRDPQRNEWRLNIPPDKQSLDEILGGYVQQGKMDISEAYKLKSEASMTAYERILQQEAAKTAAGANDTKPSDAMKTLKQAEALGTPETAYDRSHQRVTDKGGLFGIGKKTKTVPALTEVLARHGINASEHFQERGSRKLDAVIEANRKKKLSRTGAALAARR